MSDEIELTPTSYIVLGLVDRLGETTPYQLKQAVASSIGNFWSVPHSQVYREADRLTRSGYLSASRSKTPGGRPRNLVVLTSRGRLAFERWLRSTTNELPELRDPALLRLFFDADLAPLARAQLAAHRRQLESYRQRRKHDTPEPAGPRLTLEAGIAHEREWVRFWSRLSGDGAREDG